MPSHELYEGNCVEIQWKKIVNLTFTQTCSLLITVRGTRQGGVALLGGGEVAGEVAVGEKSNYKCRG